MRTSQRSGRRLTAFAVSVAAVAVVVSPAGTGEALAAARDCFDRSKQPYTSVVDAHLHFRPFGGRAIPFEEVTGYLNKTGVHYANMFGIGQVLPADSDCTYYLDCPGTPVRPRMRNDFANAESLREFRPADPNLALSMTFMDLHHPETVPDGIALLDREYPGMFRWAGEVNVVKQALFPNLAEPATSEDIPRWAPFMKVYEDRGIPVTFHSDLGNDAEPTEYLHLMEEILDRYPHNKIVWAHMGLSKELAHMDPDQHIAILSRLLDEHPNLTVDLSWRVLEDLYFSKPGNREKYAAFLDRYPKRAIPGTDFVAARNKDYAVYEQELEVTSRINTALGDTAFRDIALGQNYFKLLGLKDRAPRICGNGLRPNGVVLPGPLPASAPVDDED
ncbi:amidohydrolase family protein [Streptomyces sp. NRRL WC-3742]|uniref:amidohydrolase family protein n=1 Tax=Streptomyces sp. NRRL WC-3742 TaxID=1463934 RepID=UPI00068E34C5|nr:amidohydrolase family protein [Streptomyces sp. NRRL WC-3742]